MNREELTRRLNESGLEKHVFRLLQLVKSGIGIVTHPKDEAAIPLGTSKFGGSPDLPRHEKWPELYGFPLDFIAQINLADVTDFDVDQQLPSSGVLYFFAPEAMLGAVENLWRKSRGTSLFYPGDASRLERRQGPGYQYSSCILSFMQDTTLPDYYDLVSSGAVQEMSDRDQEAYENLAEHLSVVSFLASKAHRMFGFPSHIQRASPFAEAEAIANNEEDLKELSQIDREWILLLQVDSDSNANMFWGDYGALYFCILKDDLEMERFHKVIVLTQST